MAGRIEDLNNNRGCLGSVIEFAENLNIALVQRGRVYKFINGEIHELNTIETIALHSLNVRDFSERILMPNLLNVQKIPLTGLYKITNIWVDKREERKRNLYEYLSGKEPQENSIHLSLLIPFSIYDHLKYLNSSLERVKESSNDKELTRIRRIIEALNFNFDYLYDTRALDVEDINRLFEEYSDMTLSFVNIGEEKVPNALKIIAAESVFNLTEHVELNPNILWYTMQSKNKELRLKAKSRFKEMFNEHKEGIDDLISGKISNMPINYINRINWENIAELLSDSQYNFMGKLFAENAKNLNNSLEDEGILNILDDVSLANICIISDNILGNTDQIVLAESGFSKEEALILLENVLDRYLDTPDIDENSKFSRVALINLAENLVNHYGIKLGKSLIPDKIKLVFDQFDEKIQFPNKFSYLDGEVSPRLIEYEAVHSLIKLLIININKITLAN